MTTISVNEGQQQYDPTKIWTTLLTNRAYFGGLLVLDHSLRKSNSRYQLKVMVTRDVEKDEEYMGAFAAAGIPTIVVDKIEPAPRDGKVNRGTWEKLAPWSFTEYESDVFVQNSVAENLTMRQPQYTIKRVVLLDSDQIIRQNIDYMMEFDLPDGWIASTHACTCNPRKLPHYSKDWVPENCAFTAANQETGEPAPITESSPNNHHLLNSGTVVLRPSKEQFDALIDAMNTHPDVPNMLFFDQDLLAIIYRGKWKPLPYKYNALKPMRDCHASLWRDEDVKILHYILNKPWKSRTYNNDRIESTHKLWWDEYAEVEEEWVSSPDQEKRELWKNVVVPIVAQE
ncbi:glycosyltransferase family 8 protein [Xylariaceae sp. AK1471]|nr:glycosyltransferase family 8 protein [Xylariaceae sp. AK1471]